VLISWPTWPSVVALVQNNYKVGWHRICNVRAWKLVNQFTG